MTASSAPPTQHVRRIDISLIVIVMAITTTYIVNMVLRHNIEVARIQAGAK